VPVEEPKKEVTLEALATEEGAIAEIFSGDAVAALSTEEKQAVFEKLMVFNTKYLEEKRILEEAEASVTGIPYIAPTKPKMADVPVGSDARMEI